MCGLLTVHPWISRPPHSQPAHGSGPQPSGLHPNPAHDGWSWSGHHTTVALICPKCRRLSTEDTPLPLPLYLLSRRFSVSLRLSCPPPVGAHPPRPASRYEGRGAGPIRVGVRVRVRPASITKDRGVPALCCMVMHAAQPPGLWPSEPVGPTIAQSHPCPFA